MDKNQPVGRAIYQRECILRQINEALFQVLGFRRTKPNSSIGFAIFGLGRFKPDLILTKDECLLIIELKAYYKDWICAEPEIAQILKYAVKVGNEKGELKKFSPKKFLLITSGSLVSYKKVGYFDKNIDFERQSISPMIEDRYKRLLDGLEEPISIDDREAERKYKRILNKARKSKNFLRLDILDQLPIPPYEIINLESLQNYLTEEGEISIGLISAPNFQRIIEQLNKPIILEQFKKLRNTPLEELMNDISIFNSLGFWEECKTCKENKPPYYYCKYDCEIVRLTK
ncbi:MAG: hypothetical protein HWN67_20555 [Candidatus Helarchaeota archaeon]|nr:hypothetical protein [Candidatus Helarchaeota archaeon]